MELVQKGSIRGDFVDSTATVLTSGDEMPLGDRLLGEVMVHANAGDPVLEALRRSRSETPTVSDPSGRIAWSTSDRCQK